MYLIFGHSKIYQNDKKYFCSISYSLWYIKIDSSQNQDLSTSLKRPYKNQVLNTVTDEV